MTRIAVVTDSTCDVGPEGLAAMGVPMVPLKVHFGADTFVDWTDFTPAEFYPKLVSASQNPTTSQPSPADFAAVYERLAAEGAEGIVVVTISMKLSGTYESATLAAADSPVPVRVVDSLTVSGGAALVVERAVEARDAGGDLAAVEKAAADAAPTAELYFVLDTLDYLVRGGRAGKAQGLAASLLNIKPVLQVRDGVIEPFKKVKGTRKAYQEMAAHAAKRSRELGGVRLVVIHAVAPELAAQMIADLQDAGLVGTIERTEEIGSVIGTHVGPKCVGVAFIPKG
ncbi:MAG TPA: DegV family protein [Coriobacteriia bacterium]